MTEYELWGEAPARRGRVRAAVGAAVAATVILAACGTASPPTRTSSSAAQAPTTSAGAVSGKPATPRFLRQVNNVCIAVRQGAPPPPHPPYTARALTAYARAARPAAQRTAVSLERLATSADGRALKAIADDYRQAEATYAATGIAARGRKAATSLGNEIAIREQTLSAAARTSGIPACAVAGR